MPDFVARSRTYTDDVQNRINTDSRARRAHRRDAGECVNGCGPKTHGCRCFRCWLVHRVGVVVAVELLAKPLGHCAHCEQLIPAGYVVEVEGGGKAHPRCAATVAA